jgi:signal transduction histidine kinase
MSVAARLNGRITQLAVGRHLPYRTVRVRLTALYGGLFLLSGAALMAIAYLLLINAGFVFTLQDSSGNQPANERPSGAASQTPAGGFPAPGAKTYATAQTMAYWRGVAQCMHRHGISRFPEPSNSVPRHGAGIGVLSDRDGAILLFPATMNQQGPAFAGAASACGYAYDSSSQAAQTNVRRTQVRQELLVQSGIALAAMSLLSLGLGWLMAGRVLQPLRRSYEAQRQFVANASHELRAPLTRLRTLSEVALASSNANVASLRRNHERVLASEQHLERLIDALLALTRSQAGLQRRERLDLAALTSHAVLGHQSRLTDLHLDVRATFDPAQTDGDPRLIERLIDNLIDNAIRHNTSGGQLEITTGTRDRHAYLAIANTGPSIPSEEIHRLWQPFQRLDSARTQHNNGHGLGLSIVHAIADAHDAKLDARARPEGGLAIKISFPPPAGRGPRATAATLQPDAVSRSGFPVSETDIHTRG